MGPPPMPIEVKVVRTRSGIRNAHTRMPFRFGVITMRAAPLLTLAAEIEDARGRRAIGYAADFLAYRWFDKRPDKSLADNCADLLRTVDRKSTRLNSSHVKISYAVFCLKKKKKK